jgi:hypothetical protein
MMPSTVEKFVNQSTKTPELEGSNTATDVLRQRVWQNIDTKRGHQQ